MNYNFKSLQEANAYQIFSNEILMSRISWFSPLSTIIHFTVLSKHFYKLLNDPKSEFGRLFWKNWAVKTNTIKYLKLKTHNYKLKLVKSMITRKQRKFNSYPRYGINFCRRCNLKCHPDYKWSYYLPKKGEYCNCKIVDCDTQLDRIRNSFQKRRENLELKRINLIKQLENISVEKEKINKAEENFNKIPLFKSMLPVLKKLKENARYKNSRSLAKSLYNDTLNLYKLQKRKRKNINYNNFKKF